MGGKVALLEGQYNIVAKILLSKASITLEGQDPHGTLLFVPNNTNLNDEILHLSGVAGVGLERAVLRNFRVHGNRGNNGQIGQHAGLFINNAAASLGWITLENLYLLYCARDGFWPKNIFQSTIINMVCRNNGSCGFELENCRGLVFVGGSFSNNVSTGGRFLGGSYGNLLLRPHFEDNDRGVHIYDAWDNCFVAPHYSGNITYQHFEGTDARRNLLLDPWFGDAPPVYSLYMTGKGSMAIGGYYAKPPAPTQENNIITNPTYPTEWWHIGPREQKIYELIVNYNDASPKDLLTIKGGEAITDVWVYVGQTWNAVGCALNIGDGADNDGFMEAHDINLGAVGYYGVNHNERGVYLWDPIDDHDITKAYTAGSVIRAYITPGAGGTQGYCRVYIRVAKIL